MLPFEMRLDLVDAHPTATHIVPSVHRRLYLPGEDSLQRPHDGSNLQTMGRRGLLLAAAAGALTVADCAWSTPRHQAWAVEALHVGPGQQFTSIAQALDQASPGATVTVHAGRCGQRCLSFCVFG